MVQRKVTAAYDVRAHGTEKGHGSHTVHVIMVPRKTMSHTAHGHGSIRGDSARYLGQRCKEPKGERSRVMPVWLHVATRGFQPFGQRLLAVVAGSTRPLTGDVYPIAVFFFVRFWQPRHVLVVCVCPRIGAAAHRPEVNAGSNVYVE